MLITLLEYMRGLRYLRLSAAIQLVLYPAFLFAPSLPLKLVLVSALRFFNAGFYPTRTTLFHATWAKWRGSFSDHHCKFCGRIDSLMYRVIAQQCDLATAMWVLWLAPMAILIGLPRRA